MIRSSFLLAASMTAATLLSGCPSPPTIPTSFSFNRPGGVDFVCLRVPVGADGRISNDTLTMGAEVEAFPIAQCPSVNTASNSDVQMVGDGFVGLRLFALVTQADRGELAVVNLHPRFNTGNVDTQPRVPGFTFIPTGAFAGPVVVHPSGRATYVANTGERTITILDNRRLLAGRRFELEANGARLSITDLPAPPADLAVRSFGDPALHGLYVLLQDGTVRVYDITDPLVPPVLRSEVRLSSSAANREDAGEDGGRDAADAERDVVDGSSGDSARDASSDGEHHDASDVDDAHSARDSGDDVEDGAASDVFGSDATDLDVTDAFMMDGSTTTDASDASADRGAMDASIDARDAEESGRMLVERMAVADDGRVFVSDRGLPIVHVLAPGTAPFSLREVESLDAGVGTTQIAVSPRLPSDGTHWVYAVTTGDRQLIALDATLRNGAPSPSYGTRARANAIADHPGCAAAPFDERACPKIDPNLPHDRVPVRAPARAVGFVAVSSRSESGQASCDVSQPLVENCSSFPQPRLDIFRGVQAVVALANAQIQLVDLEDPDRNCAVRVGQSVQRAFLRHIPRGGDATSRPSLIGAPQLTINGGAASFGGPNPRIVAIDGSETVCDANNNHCVVLPPQPQAPSLIDPVAVRDATYVLRYEGQLPLRSINAASFRAAAETGTIRMLAPGSRLCQLGALAGDRVVLAGPSPFVDTSIRADASVPIPSENPMCPAARCREVFGDSNARCNREFAVRRAMPDALELELPRTRVGAAELAGESCGAVTPPGGAGGFEASAAEFTRLLECCYPQATKVEVRATGRWVLAISPAGRSIEFPNDVVERDGVCVQDPSVGPSGRVRENEVYDARWFRIRIASGTQPTPRDTTITFRTGGGYAQLVSNTGAAGAQAVRYVCGSDRVYIVDQTPSALKEYSLAPFVQTRTFN